MSYLLGWIKQSKRNGKTGCTLIIQDGDGKVHKVDCPFFCPANVGDAIYGPVNKEGQFTYQPFVQASVTPDGIKNTLIQALRIRPLTADKLFDELESIADPPTERLEGVPHHKVSSYLTDLSLLFRKERKVIIGLLAANTLLEERQCEKLMTWWYKKWALRRLYLFTLNNKEIRGTYNPNLNIIYDTCMTNPYKLASVPLEKAEVIMKSRGDTPSMIDISCGKIIRTIYRCLERGWAATPFWLLNKEHPRFHSLIPTLEKEYDVVFEYNSAFLRCAYDSEVSVAQFPRSKD